MNELEQRVDALLSSPLGCAFVLAVESNDRPLETFALPEMSFQVAASCVDFCDVNKGDGDQFQRLALRYGQRRRALARSILEHPAFAWWFDPVDLDNQVWVAPNYPHGEPGHSHFKLLNVSEWREPTSPPGGWSLSAQKPDLQQSTSTKRGELTSELAAYNIFACDHICTFPLARWHLRILEDVRVYEIKGPADWHELCLRYTGKGDDGRLAPDWGAVAADWDGVHLTFGGLLSCEQSRYEKDGQWSKHQFWHVEETHWLRALDVESIRLPDYEENHSAPLFDFPFFEEGSLPGSSSSGFFLLRGQNGLDHPVSPPLPPRKLMPKWPDLNDPRIG